MNMMVQPHRFSAAGGTLHSSTITIASGEVGSNLTNFPVYVALADLPAGFWAAVASNGSNIRVKDDLAAEVPFHLVTFDYGGEAGDLFFLADLLAASDNEFTIEVVSGATAPAVTDPIGRNAVWNDYEVVYFFTGDLVDSVGDHDLTAAVGSAAYADVAMGAGGGLDVTANTRLQVSNALATGTSFTLAATASFSTLASTPNYCVVQTLESIGGSNGRSALLLHNTTGDPLAQWDITNLFNDGPGAVIDTPYRMVGTWNSTTERKFYVNGSLSATDPTITAMGTSNDSITIADNGAGTAFFRGKIGFVYVRLSILSADWIAAEYSNLNAPASFYSVS